MLTKQRRLSLPRDLALGTYCELLIKFSITIKKPAITLLFNGPSASDEAKSFSKNLTRNSNLDDSVISSSVFPS